MADMPLRDWFKPPRSLLALYVVGAVTGLAALVWLTGRLLTQEQVVEVERLRLQLESAADRAVARAQHDVVDLDRWLSQDAGDPPAGTVVVLVEGETFRARPAGRLPFVPVVPLSPEPAPGVFVEGERVEFGGAGPAPAIGLYRTLAASRDRLVRAGALHRLGRTLRRAGRTDEALRAYDELQKLDDVSVEGRPADLLAREARCSILAETGARTALEREASDLRRDLARGRWPLAETRWRFLFDEASEWAGRSAPPIDGLDDAVGLARGVDAFWRQSREGQPLRDGTVAMRVDDRPSLARVQTTATGLRAVIAGPAFLDQFWRAVAADAGVRLAVLDRDGQTLFGQPAGVPVTRSATATGLPWTLAVASLNPAEDAARAGASRRLLIAVLAIVFALVVGSSYFTFRGIRRELATARLQSEFVSAVSHEFRTPLTSIRQLSHMLRQGRVIDEDRRGQYYDVLVRESERLHRLVERLLSFGRAESDRYRFESIDAGELARAVATEFEPHAGHRPLDVHAPAPPCLIRADREMLSLALWNLLDNAVKYAPDGRPVQMAVAANGAHVRVAVRDEGPGIAPEEQRRIFQKFVRGGAETTRSVPGSGLGLALVKRVAEAHGGSVELASAPGRGSTFTIVLPIAERSV